MTNSSQNQYIELAYKVVDKLNEFKSLKKDNELLHNDLSKYKSFVLKEKEILNEFTGIKNDLINRIKSRKFDLQQLNTDLQQLKKLRQELDKLKNKKNELTNLISKASDIFSGYDFVIKNTDDLISSIYNKMEFLDIQKYTDNLALQLNDYTQTKNNISLILDNLQLINLFNGIKQELSENIRANKFNYSTTETLLKDLSNLKNTNTNLVEKRNLISNKISAYSLVLKGYENNIHKISDFLKFCETNLRQEQLNKSLKQVNDLQTVSDNKLSEIDKILKHKELISEFKGIETDFIHIIEREQFDKNVAKGIFSNLTKINEQIANINSNIQKLNEMSDAYSNDISAATKSINNCKSSMKITEIDTYINNFQSIISKLDNYISNSKDKFGRLSNLHKKLENSKNVWYEDINYLLPKVQAAINELKTKDIDIEFLFSELKNLEEKKTKAFKYLTDNLTNNTYNYFSKEIENLKNTQCSSSDYESLKTTINRYITKENSSINQKINIEKAKIIGIGVLTIFNLILFFSFTWYFIVLSILLGAGHFFINVNKIEEDLRNDEFLNGLFAGLVVAGIILVVGCIVSAIWSFFVVFISIFFILLFAGLFVVYLFAGREKINEINVSLQRTI